MKTISRVFFALLPLCIAACSHTSPETIVPGATAIEETGSPHATADTAQTLDLSTGVEKATLMPAGSRNYLGGFFKVKVPSGKILRISMINLPSGASHASIMDCASTVSIYIGSEELYSGMGAPCGSTSASPDAQGFVTLNPQGDAGSGVPAQGLLLEVIAG